MTETSELAGHIAMIRAQVRGMSPALANAKVLPEQEISELGLDSVDVIELIGIVENHVGVEISDNDLSTVRTFADLAHVIFQLTSQSKLADR